MRIPERIFLSTYSAAMRLYPDPFRRRYHAQMLDAVYRSYGESTGLGTDLRLATALVKDTVRGAFREHARAASPARPGYMLAFAVFFSVLQVAAAVSYQQYLRRGADCHPSMLVSQAAAEPAGRSEVFDGSRREIATQDWLKGDESFAVLYSATGRPIAGNATLHGMLPRPPAGIFEYLRSHDSDRVTWQPEQGIRIALVGQRLPDGRFVLAGKSLIDGESREARFHRLMLVIWFFMVATIVTLVLHARYRPAPHRTGA